MRAERRGEREERGEKRVCPGSVAEDLDSGRCAYACMHVVHAALCMQVSRAG